MSFMNYIVDGLNDASDFFYSIYRDVLDWVWPFWEVATFFYSLSIIFNWLAWDFSDFFSWLLTKAAEIDKILSWSNIRSLILGWLPGLEDAIDWWSSWWIWISQEIDDWWLSTRYVVLAWINDLESWTTAQLNSVRDWVLALISDVESWTLTQINSVRVAILTIVSNLEAWTITEFNIVRDWVLVLIGGVESWTLTQINNVKSAILAIIGDLELWTQTEINTITALLSALIDWPALTAWITTWWNDRLFDISALIDSAFGLRDSLWAGWQDIRDRVFEFFEDPVDFIWLRFTNWFLGPEV